MASLELSHKTTFCAPLLKNSNPIAPLPANKSKTIASSILFCIILKTDSFTLSSVGLVLVPSNVNNFVPLALPLIILIAIFSLSYLYYYFILFFYIVKYFN